MSFAEDLEFTRQDCPLGTKGDEKGQVTRAGCSCSPTHALRSHCRNA